MIDPLVYRLAADLVLALHVAFVAFVILGLVLTYAGAVRGWVWVRDRWFRRVHLGAIGFVVIQAWLGAICPLTALEMTLRQRAGDAVYQGSFIAHWLHELLYFEAPFVVFTIGYTLFGLLVAASWIIVRPAPPRQRDRTGCEAQDAGT
ncbi:MAG: hypothetical protein CMJ18_27150 [Phycisphaeraceae bacterium]|nr:hypothetical protein [Phycisphaeraceae bacterium]